MTELESLMSTSEPFTESFSGLRKLRRAKHLESSKPVLNFDMPISQGVLYLLERTECSSVQNERISPEA
jgi:hypothetical protein